MNIRKQIIQEVKTAIEAMAPELPLLLAAYVTGDYFIGRPLWNSPVEVAVIVDVAASQSGFARQRLPLTSTELQHLHDGLAGLSYRCTIEQCRLEENKGRFAIYQAKFVSALVYYQIAMAVIKGQPVYYADDFLYQKFEADTRALWINNEKVQIEAWQTLGKLFTTYKLAAIPHTVLPRLDVVQVVEMLNILQTHLNVFQRHGNLDFDKFVNASGMRNRLRFGVERMSLYMRDITRHIVTRMTRHEPQNYTQLFDVMAQMGIIAPGDVAGLTIIAERPILTPGWRQPGDDELEAFYLVREYGDHLVNFVSGVVHYLHREAQRLGIQPPNRQT